MTPDPIFPHSARFQLRDVLGRGSMGTVYRAFDQETGRDVALKTLRETGSTALYQLKEEFRSLRDIAHPNLVELYDLVVGDEQSFFTMELVDGVDILAHLAGGGPEQKPRDRLARLQQAAVQLKRGVSTLHAAGKLHRDIKPRNILVASDGRVVLLDFGLATSWRQQGSVDDQEGFAGSLPYMSPEQIWGKPLRPSADWYSVGVLLYEALTGRLPFPESPHEMLASKQRPASVPPPSQLAPEIPSALDQVVMGLLAPDPSQRPGNDEIDWAFSHVGAGAGVPRPHERSEVSTHERSEISTRELFVGRQRELDQLQAALDGVQAGLPALVRINGPSGIGKTELAQRFVTAIGEDARALTFHARCHPQELVPFNAFDGIVDQLSQHLTHLPAAEAAALEPSGSSALVRLFPVLGRVQSWVNKAAASDGMEPRLVRAQGLVALRALLAGMGRDRPLVLWIDDQQWSDADSDILLHELLRPAASGRLLVLLTYLTDQDPGVAVRDTVGAHLPPARRHEIVCGPLPPADARLLARRIMERNEVAPQPLEQQVETIVSESAGSPFFIAQLARHAPAVSSLTAAGSAGAALLSAVMHSRIAALSSVERRIVEIVAVAAGDIDRSVALRAAGTGEGGRPDVARLTRHHLLKATERPTGIVLEAYHHRVRVAIVTTLAEPELRERNLAIAEALELASRPDPQASFRHWLAAGDRTRAVGHARRAAEMAAATLAFEHAAQLYGQVAELQADDREAAARARVQQADALVNAGHGAEAAPLYLGAAAVQDDPTAAADLRRRAAESFLVSGHIDQGVDVLAQDLARAGVRYPPTPRAALIAVFKRLLQVRWTGFGFRERAPQAVSPGDLLRVDLCLSAAKGLFLVDALRGAAFAFEALRAALKAGEPQRVCEALGMVGVSVLAPAGGWMERWGLKMLDRAREIASNADSPRLHGLTQTLSGQVKTFAGDWRGALADCDAGVDELTARCRGVAWELNIGYMGSLRAVEELGHLQDYRRRCQRLLADADARGDVYARVTAVLYEALAYLAADQPEVTRLQTAASMSVWTQSAFSVQHLYSIRLDAFADLYQGRPQDAWARLTAAWPALKRSGLLRIPIMRIDAHALRARVALALAASPAGASAPRAAAASPLRDCQRYRRLLAKETRPDSPGHAFLLAAGELAGAATRAEASRLLDAAIATYRANGMGLWVCYAQYRQGQLSDSAAGASLCADALAAMRAEGIAKPLRWLEVVAPGRWRVQP